MRYDGVGIPTAATTKPPRESDVRVVHFDPIWIYAVERSCGILLACPAASLVAGEVLKHCSKTLGTHIHPSTGTDPKHIDKTNATPGSAIVNLGLIQKRVRISR